MLVTIFNKDVLAKRHTSSHNVVFPAMPNM